MRPGSPRTTGPSAHLAHEDRGLAPVLVLAVGNLLLGDDGCGQAVLAELTGMRGRWGAAVDFVDGGTQGMALLGLVSGRRAVLVLDAVKLGAAPGTVHTIRGPDVMAAIAARGLTAHEGNAGELLRGAALLGEMPGEVAVVGVEPEILATGIGLSAPVQASVPAALCAATGVLDGFVSRLGQGQRMP